MDSIASFNVKHYAVFDGVKAGIFVLADDAGALETLASQPSSKFENTTVKPIPGDTKGKNKRYFFEAIMASGLVP